MKAKLLIEGKEIEVDISEEEYKKIQPTEEKKTGYERETSNNEFYYVTAEGSSEAGFDRHDCIDDAYYVSANYYSCEIVAQNNARADKLMRQLRRFAIKHRESDIDWNDTDINKFCIYYEYDRHELDTNSVYFSKVVGGIYFDSIEAAEAAKNEFYDELIWYFTEYKDSL